MLGSGPSSNHSFAGLGLRPRILGRWSRLLPLRQPLPHPGGETAAAIPPRGPRAFRLMLPATGSRLPWLLGGFEYGGF